MSRASIKHVLGKPCASHANSHVQRNFPENQSQRVIVETILVGRLGVGAGSYEPSSGLSAGNSYDYDTLIVRVARVSSTYL